MRFWQVKDVMTADVVSVAPDTPYRDLLRLLADRRISAVPVVDDDRRVLGVVSESDLIAKTGIREVAPPRWFERRRRAAYRRAAGRTAADLMTAPAVVVLTMTRLPTAVRRIGEAGVNQLPVEDELGRLVGIVTRGDLLRAHSRSDEEIATEVRAAITEVLRAEDCSVVKAEVELGVVTLIGRVERCSTAALITRMVSQVPGVIEVVERLTYDHDDHRGASVAVGSI